MRHTSHYFRSSKYLSEKLSLLKFYLFQIALHTSPCSTLIVKRKKNRKKKKKHNLVCLSLFCCSLGNSQKHSFYSAEIFFPPEFLPLSHVVCSGLVIRSLLEHLQISTLHCNLCGNLLMICNCSKSRVDTISKCFRLCCFGLKKEDSDEQMASKSLLGATLVKYSSSFHRHTHSF